MSLWGDPIWNLWPWAGKILSLNFGDGPKARSTSFYLDSQNADLLRIAMTWRIWGFRGIKAVNTIMQTYGALKPAFIVASRNGILASDLSRYPKVVEELMEEIAPSSFNNVINELNNLHSAREFLGFTLLDDAGLAQLKVADPGHNHRQTEYIPPRIWQYQVKRLKEFIDDYLHYQNKIEECYAFCLDAYLECNGKNSHHKIGSTPLRNRPFSGDKSLYGPFLETAERFGIKDILEKWVVARPQQGIKLLSMYLNTASYVGLAYTLNFTLARSGEGMNLRFNCLKSHDDDVYGQVTLIEGKTTKIIQDDAALWVASPSVKQAITVMQSVVKMRLGPSPSKDREGDVYLINFTQERWKIKKRNPLIRPKNEEFSSHLSQCPLLFDKNQLLITEEDFKIAIAATPTLDKNIFQVGKPWVFTWHQLRRTGAVNMFSSGEISDSTIQLQLKHLSPVMTQYYGRGHTTLNLNEEVKSLIVNAQYEAMGKRLVEAESNSFISPFGSEHKERLLTELGSKDPVNLIAENKVAHFQKAARNQKINFRVTAIGACMKNGRCDGDGFSSLGDCAGGDGRAPCANALFDRNRSETNKTRLEMVIKQMESAQPNTSRYNHLEQERRGLENYFAYINQNQ